MVFFCALAGLAYYSLPAPVNPSEQHISTQTAHQEPQKYERSFRGFINFLFPDALAIFTFFLVLATIALGAIAYVQIEFLKRAERISADSAEATKQSAEISERALFAANRPWIKVDIGVGGPVTYDVNGVNFTFKFVLRNIGHSPATNVWVNPTAFLSYVTDEPGDHPSALNARKELLKKIAERKVAPASPFGFAMFPDDVVDQEIKTTISKEEIDRATKLIKALYPAVYGVVEYRTGLDTTSHYTGFIFEIRRDDKPRPFTIEGRKWPAAIWIEEGDVPTTEIRLWRSFIEGGYAD